MAERKDGQKALGRHGDPPDVTIQLVSITCTGGHHRRVPEIVGVSKTGGEPNVQDLLAEIETVKERVEEHRRRKKKPTGGWY